MSFGANCNVMVDRYTCFEGIWCMGLSNTFHIVLRDQADGFADVLYSVYDVVIDGLARLEISVLDTQFRAVLTLQVWYKLFHNPLCF